LEGERERSPGLNDQLRLPRPGAEARGRVALISDAVLLETCNSGVIFDCFAGEGFWVFMDPRDTGSYIMLGVEMRRKTHPFSKPMRRNRPFPARDKANVVAAPCTQAGAPPRVVHQQQHTSDYIQVHQRACRIDAYVQCLIPQTRICYHGLLVSAHRLRAGGLRTRVLSNGRARKPHAHRDVLRARVAADIRVFLAQTSLSNSYKTSTPSPKLPPAKNSATCSSTSR
jgi:hypothetical protein